jgi:hypothetical protein
MIVSDTSIGASLAYDTSSVNYDRNMFIIQATEKRDFCLFKKPFLILLLSYVVILGRHYKNFYNLPQWSTSQSPNLRSAPEPWWQILG